MAAAPVNSLSLLEVGPLLFGGVDGIIAFMRTRGLLGNRALCVR